MLSPDEEADLRRLAAEKDARLDRLHRRIVELYVTHRDDPDQPVTQKQLAELTGYTETRVWQIVKAHTSG